MDDEKIVDLYWQRSEDAIPETSAKYGSYCRIIAYNILSDFQDADECVNDTWLGAWNSMPTNRPSKLAPYLGKLTRWLSLTRLRDKNCLKRGGGEASIALEELSECLDSVASPEKQVEQKMLAEAMHSFLAGLDEQQRNVFLARYWFMASVKEIAEKFGFGQSKVKSMLMRTRRELKIFLEEAELC
jgi:RNA polymerase sigma-70 factor (ECF subfamily)